MDPAPNYSYDLLRLKQEVAEISWPQFPDLQKRLELLMNHPSFVDHKVLHRLEEVSEALAEISAEVNELQQYVVDLVETATGENGQP